MEETLGQTSQPKSEGSLQSVSNLLPNQKPKRKISLPAILISIFILIITVASIGVIYYVTQQKKVASVNDFEGCVAAGNPIQESYPEQCSANGQTFTRKLTEEEKKKLNSDSTANWKAYEDIMYGYSFKYPNEWNADYACFNRDTVSECSNSVNFIESYSSKKIEEIKAIEGGGSINSSNFINNIPNEANGVIISFYYDDNYKNLNINEFITSKDELNLKNTKSTEELKGVNKFTKISSDENDGKNSATYLIQESSGDYVIIKVKIVAKDGNYEAIPNTEYNQYLDDVEKVLSSFKFMH